MCGANGAKWVEGNHSSSALPGYAYSERWVSVKYGKCPSPERCGDKAEALDVGSLAGILGDLGQVSCKHVNFHVGGRLRVWLVTWDKPVFSVQVGEWSGGLGGLGLQRPKFYSWVLPANTRPWTEPSTSRGLLEPGAWNLLGHRDHLIRPGITDPVVSGRQTPHPYTTYTSEVQTLYSYCWKGVGGPIPWMH